MKVFAAQVAFALALAAPNLRAATVEEPLQAELVDRAAYRKLTGLMILADAHGGPPVPGALLDALEESLRRRACWRLTPRAASRMALPLESLPAPRAGRWLPAEEVSARILRRLPRRASRLGLVIVWMERPGAAAQVFETASGAEIWRGRVWPGPGQALGPEEAGRLLARELIAPPNVDGGCSPRPELAPASKRTKAVLPAVASAIANLSNTSTAKRAEAAKSLGRPDNEDGVLPLLMALDDPDPKVRAAAADSLGAIDSPKAVNGLVELLSDSSPDIRAIAARSLGLIGSDRASPGLKDLLAVEREARVRSAAEDALKKINDPLSLKLDVSVPGED